MILFLKRLDNPDAQMRMSGAYALGLLMQTGIVDRKVIDSFGFIDKLVNALGDPESWKSAAAATALGHGLEKGVDIGKEVESRP